MFGACSDGPADPVLQLNSAPQFTAPTAGTTFTLVEAEADNNLPTFSWSAADFGYSVGVALPSRASMRVVVGAIAGNSIEGYVSSYQQT